MKVSDYIVHYLIEYGITDVFGYPGGMVTHLMDSFSHYTDRITAHMTYHEQAAAFAACGYALASGKPGVAYATSGPGATNLITGICDAYFDSIPVLFLTGQVNTFESKDNLPVRQRGFQETDIVSMVSGVTKYAVRIQDASQVVQCLNHAFFEMEAGRKGPVLLDIPMNIFREEVTLEKGKQVYVSSEVEDVDAVIPAFKDILSKALHAAKRPVLLLGNGVKIAGAVELSRKIVRALDIPVVTTMMAVDVTSDEMTSYGFVGAYGSRSANFLVAKADLVISLGARMDVRQVGAKRSQFAPGAKIIRVDIDPGELQYKVHDDEIALCGNVISALKALEQIASAEQLDYSPWRKVCNKIESSLKKIDKSMPNEWMKQVARCLPENALVTADVGQNQVWTAQSLTLEGKQKICFSGGHGAMGFSLPAAIGCALATRKAVYSINGDGGFQMNLQELQTIVREKLPVKIVLFNNKSLGMIRHFQEMYFQNNYVQTVSKGGYTVPDFGAIAVAYGITYMRVDDPGKLKPDMFTDGKAGLIEIELDENTYVFPKIEFGNPNQDQEPLIDRALYHDLMEL